MGWPEFVCFTAVRQLSVIIARMLEKLTRWMKCATIQTLELLNSAPAVDGRLASRNGVIVTFLDLRVSVDLRVILGDRHRGGVRHLSMSSKMKTKIKISISIETVDI